MALFGEWRFWHLASLLASRLSARNILRYSALVGFHSRLRAGGKRARLAGYYRSWAELAGKTADVRSLVREYFFSRVLLKTGHAVLALSPDKTVSALVREEGYHHVEEALREGKGVVLASLHTCSGALCASFAVRRGARVLGIRQPEKQRIRGDLHRKLVFYGAEPVFVEPDDPPAAVLKRAFNELRRNAVFMVLLDGQFGARIVPLTVAGRQALIRTGLVDVARLSGSAIIPCFATASREGITVHYFPPRRLQSEDEVGALVDYLGESFERFYMDHPACIEWRHFDRALLTDHRSPIYSVPVKAESAVQSGI